MMYVKLLLEWIRTDDLNEQMVALMEAILKKCRENAVCCTHLQTSSIYHRITFVRTSIRVSIDVTFFTVFRSTQLNLFRCICRIQFSSIIISSYGQFPHPGAVRRSRGQIFMLVRLPASEIRIFKITPGSHPGVILFRVNGSPAPIKTT